MLGVLYKVKQNGLCGDPVCPSVTQCQRLYRTVWQLTCRRQFNTHQPSNSDAVPTAVLSIFLDPSVYKQHRRSPRSTAENFLVSRQSVQITPHFTSGIKEFLLVLSTIGAVHNWCCPQLVLSTTGAVHNWCWPQLVLSTIGAVHNWCCPQLVLATTGAVHNWCCPQFLSDFIELPREIPALTLPLR